MPLGDPEFLYKDDEYLGVNQPPTNPDEIDYQLTTRFGTA